MVKFYDFNSLAAQLKEAESDEILKPQHTRVVAGRKRVIDVTTNSQQSVFLFNDSSVYNRKGFYEKAKELINEGFSVCVMACTNSLDSLDDLDQLFKNKSTP